MGAPAPGAPTLPMPLPSCKIARHASICEPFAQAYINHIPGLNSRNKF